jgi:hypothetical protein
MSDDAIDPSELEAQVDAAYRGPLDEFINRRDALAKELRASKRKDDADRVKALRKPSRAAWVLDQVVFEEPACVAALARAIAEAQDAHADAADARAAQENVRAAVRAVADAGARAAIRGRQPIDSSELVAAVRAVIGDAEAFAALRAGRLVDVPEGGGLDLLAAMSLGGWPAAASAGAPAPSKAGTAPATKPGKRVDVSALTRAELQRAETSLGQARSRAQVAERAVVSARARLEAAEEQLQRAQEQSKARRGDLERAHKDASAAVDAVKEAEKAVAELRARVATRGPG